MTILRLSLDEACAVLAAGELDRRVGFARGVPAVAVDLASGDAGGDVADALRGLPAVAIAVVPRGAVTRPTDHGDWDLVTNDPDRYASALAHTPQAAVMSAQVLRDGGELPTTAALRLASLAYATLQAGPEHRTWLAGRGRRVRTDDRPRVQVTGSPDGAATIVLDRPRLKNLVDARMRDELVEVLRALGHDPDRPIVVRGAGNDFCAGGDPAEFGTVTDPPTAHLVRSSADVAPWLARVADRTTVHVHGVCVGAGVELAAFAHRVVATRDASFRLPELTMGLLPGAGGMVSIPRRIGRVRTLDWLLTDDTIDAATAHRWGLVDELVDEWFDDSAPA